MDDKRIAEIRARVAMLVRWLARWRAWFHYIREFPKGHVIEGEWAKRCDEIIEQKHGGRVKDLVSKYEIPDLTNLLDALEAARKENAELQAALKEACEYGGREITNLLRYKRDAEDYPHLAAWLRQQEGQG